jgi:hypothetical protein
VICAFSRIELGATNLLKITIQDAKRDTRLAGLLLPGLYNTPVTGGTGVELHGGIGRWPHCSLEQF